MALRNNKKKKGKEKPCPVAKCTFANGVWLLNVKWWERGGWGERKKN